MSSRTFFRSGAVGFLAAALLAGLCPGQAASPWFEEFTPVRQFFVSPNGADGRAVPSCLNGAAPGLAPNVLSRSVGVVSAPLGVGRALVLDGLADQVALPEGFCPWGADATVEVWLRTTNALSNAETVIPILGAWTGTGAHAVGQAFGIESGRIAFAAAAANDAGCFGGRLKVTGRAVSDGSWHHLALVLAFNAGRVRLYVDGQLSADEGVGDLGLATCGVPAMQTLGGIGGSPGVYLGGTLDELRIYRRALSAAEITARFNGGQGLYDASESGVVGAWHFDETNDEVSGVSLASAIQGAKPGDLYWIFGGNYTGSFTNRRGGTASAPIVYRAVPRERATIEGSIEVYADHVWIWGLEVTDPQFIGGGAGINLYGAGIRAINNVVHHQFNKNGIGAWSFGPGQVLYGNIVFENGQGTNSPHGLYVQNDFARFGYKYIVHNLLLDAARVGANRFNLHAYAECSDCGPLITGLWIEGNGVAHGSCLVGGFNDPVTECVLRGNYFFDADVQIGFRRPAQVEFTGNYLGRGGLMADHFWGSDEVLFPAHRPNVFVGNTILAPPGRHLRLRTSANLADGRCDGCTGFAAGDVFESNRYSAPLWISLTARSNAVDVFNLPGWTNATASAGKAFDLHATADVPVSGTKAVLLTNHFERGRAHLVVYNWDLAPSVTVNLDAMARPGDAFEIRDAKDPFGPPWRAGQYYGEIHLPTGGAEFLALLVTVTARQGAALRVLPLGDSITQGNSDRDTYRRPLWQMLTNAGLAVDFVGSMSNHFNGSAPHPDFDLQHEGHWGQSTDELLAGLPAWLAGYTPDLVLLHAGSNDAFQRRPATNTLAVLGRIIDTVRADNSNVVVLLAQLIPTTDPAVNNTLAALNAQIPALASNKTTAVSPVLVVNQAAGFDAGRDTYDGVHPNAAGELKMAQRWFTGVQMALFGPAPPPAPGSVWATAGNGFVQLEWSAPADATSFNLRRAPQAGGPWTLVATNLEGNLWTDTAVTNGGTWFYTVTAVNGVGESPASLPTSATPATDPLPLVRLAFPEGAGVATTNSGTAGGVWRLTTPKPEWMTRAPAATAGSNAIDFGVVAGDYGVDSVTRPVALAGLGQFTLTGWLNNRSVIQGSSGNRILSCLGETGDGFEVIYKGDGSLVFTLNAGPDSDSPRSSTGKIPDDFEMNPANWRFFAICYDRTAGVVKFFFGSEATDAALDATRPYAGRGAIGAGLGHLTLGHMNPLARGTNTSRMFRGLIGEVQIFGLALTPQQMIRVQRSATPSGPPPRQVTVAAAGAGDAVALGVTPADVTGAAGGPAPWTRQFTNQTFLTLSAPAAVGTNRFSHWLRDGVEWTNHRIAQAWIEADAAFTAQFMSAAPTGGPIVRLRFNEGAGVTTLNEGTEGGVFALTVPTPAWSENSSTNATGERALDFGTFSGAFGVDSAAPLGALAGLTRFTLTGWLNNRSVIQGSGGNVILSWIESGSSGVELVYRNDGSLDLGINRAPDSSWRSAPGAIPADAGAARANWRFFAVTCDTGSGDVNYYFGSPSAEATLNRSLNNGPVAAIGPTVGRFSVGHLPPAHRGLSPNRIFRGLIDDVHVFDRVLSLAELVVTKQGQAPGTAGPAADPTAPPRIHAITRAAGGRVSLQITSDSGRACQVLCSTNLVHWTVLGPAIPGPDGGFEFSELPLAPHCFYRIAEP